MYNVVETTIFPLAATALQQDSEGLGMALVIEVSVVVGRAFDFEKHSNNTTIIFEAVLCTTNSVPRDNLFACRDSSMRRARQCNRAQSTVSSVAILPCLL